MHILHTEGSTGWGGQEIRILKESEGLRSRGYTIFFAVEPGAKLGSYAREKGFFVIEISFRKKSIISSLFSLRKFIKQKEIELVITHSSSDAWVGGIAARISGVKIIRMRHLSTSIRGGINSWLLYRKLADFIVTTSSGIIPTICKQARISIEKCRCIPTGVDPAAIEIAEGSDQKFRNELKISKDEILIGTVCFVRSWKGIYDFIEAARLLAKHSNLKWVIVGGGHVDAYKKIVSEKGLSEIIYFTGHLENPYPAIAAIDIFALLSTANEGISQASLQAAYLGKPMITTNIGGLPEVCLEGFTGYNVMPHAPEEVAEAVMKLAQNSSLRGKFGTNGRSLVNNKFLMVHTLSGMEEVIKCLRN